MRRREKFFEIVQRQLEGSGPERKKLTTKVLDAGVVREQSLLEPGQIFRPHIHARPTLPFRHAEPAGATLAIDAELCNEIGFCIRDNVDVRSLIVILKTRLVAGFEASSVEVGNRLFDSDRQGHETAGIPQIRDG